MSQHLVYSEASGIAPGRSHTSALPVLLIVLPSTNRLSLLKLHRQAPPDGVPSGTGPTAGQGPACLLDALASHRR